MARLQDVLTYLFKNLGDRNDLNPRRMTRILYLLDWKAAIELGSQITDVKWKIVDFEPTIDLNSVKDLVYYVEHKDQSFIMEFLDFFNKLSREEQRLSREEQSIINFVVSITAKKKDEELAHLVYSTFPAFTQDETDKIDLPDLAKKYKAVKPLLMK